MDDFDRFVAGAALGVLLYEESQIRKRNRAEGRPNGYVRSLFRWTMTIAGLAVAAALTKDGWVICYGAFVGNLLGKHLFVRSWERAKRAEQRHLWLIQKEVRRRNKLAAAEAKQRYIRQWDPKQQYQPGGRIKPDGIIYDAEPYVDPWYGPNPPKRLGP